MKSFYKKNAGSAILMIVIFTTVLSIVIGSIMRWGISDKMTSSRNSISIRANNAAENILEAGIAQLAQRWSTGQSILADELSSSNNPLVIPSGFSSLYAGTDIDISTAEIYGGGVTSGAWSYIDPSDPMNQEDPQKGKNVFAREVPILAKITANMPKADNYTAHARTMLQIRDIPVFAHAVFYNMDLEFHPGPTMNLHGPVHTNGNLYGSSSDNIYFHSSVSSANGYYHGMAPNHPEGPQSGKVWFKDGTDNFVNDIESTSPLTYYDSNHPNWAKIASNLWQGNLQTKEHGVITQNPIGYPSYLRDDPSTPEVDDDLNYAYALIEPNLKVKNKVDHPDYKDEREKEKFAYKAGLIVRLHNTTTSPHNRAHQLSPNYWVTFHKLKRTNGSNPFSDPEMTNNDELKEQNIKIDGSYVSELLTMHEYAEDGSGKPISSFYDLRRGQGLDILEIDIDKLRKSVDNTHPDYAGSGNAIWKKKYAPESDYNGLVYVEFPYSGSASGRPDNIVTSNDNLGLQVSNGGTIPNPDYNATNGFTLATNNHLYVKGHYNADGNPLTGSATEPDSGGTPEPPAALVGDAITILSPIWDYTKSKESNKILRPAIFTETNFAMIQGLVPTGKGGASVQSGGNHNFPRFLEMWSGQTFRYRGSMVALFESEISNQPHGTSFYSPPLRDWGFYEEFANGNFPPGTPLIRSFKRVSFKYLSKAEFDQELATFP